MDNVYKINEIGGMGTSGIGGGALGFFGGLIFSLLFGRGGFGGLGGFGGNAPIAGTLGAVNYAEANNQAILNRIDYNSLLQATNSVKDVSVAGFSSVQSSLCNGFAGVNSNINQSTNAIIMNNLQNTNTLSAQIQSVKDLITSNNNAQLLADNTFLKTQLANKHSEDTMINKILINTGTLNNSGIVGMRASV